MTSRSTNAIVLLFLSLLLAIRAETRSDPRSLNDKPETVVLERLNDAHHVLLIQTTNDGVFDKVLEVPCGKSSFYTTSAVVLKVDRTVDPTSTAIGVPNTGRVMEVCDTLDFITNVIDKVEGCAERNPTDPGGRKDAGWCGTVYLMPGVEADVDPYVLASGSRSFEEVDAGVCEELMAKCKSGGGGGGGGGAADVESGAGAAGEEGTKSGAGSGSLGSSALIAVLSAVGALA